MTFRSVPYRYHYRESLTTVRSSGISYLVDTLWFILLSDFSGVALFSNLSMFQRSLYRSISWKCLFHFRRSPQITPGKKKYSSTLRINTYNVYLSIILFFSPEMFQSFLNSRNFLTLVCLKDILAREINFFTSFENF